MATTSVPVDLPANDEIGLITGYIIHYDGTSTDITSVDKVYYSVPFFIFVSIALVAIFLMSRFTIEFIKRWRHQS